MTMSRTHSTTPNLTKFCLILLAFCLSIVPVIAELPVTNSLSTTASAKQASNWSISYSCTGSYTLTTPTANTMTSWRAHGGQPITGVGMTVPGSSASTSGTITATLTWIGSGPAPATVNVDVTATASAGNSGAEVDNGFPDDPINEQYGTGLGINQSQIGTHLKVLPVNNGAAVTTSILSASANYINDPSLLGGAFVGMSVKVDTRYAFIQVAGYPINHLKQATGLTYSAPITLSDGSTQQLTYPLYAPAVNTQVLLGSNLTSGGMLYLGLPVQGVDQFVFPPISVNPQTIFFQAKVDQLLIPYESYTWTSDQGGFSDTLPDPDKGWNITNLGNAYDTPLILTANPVSVSFGAVLTGGNVGLQYTWNDGVVAKCQDTIQFHSGAEYQSTLLQYLDYDPTMTWQWVPFTPATETGWIPGNSATYNAIVGDRDWTLSGLESILTLILGGLSAMDPPIGIYWSVAAAGFGITVASNPPSPTTIAISNGGDAGFDDAIDDGRVGPAGWETTDPNYQMSDFDWSAQYLPKVWYTYYLSDLWGLDGYDGQNVSCSKVPQSLKNANLQWWYYLQAPGGF